jgi:hypothetical protein
MNWQLFTQKIYPPLADFSGAIRTTQYRKNWTIFPTFRHSLLSVWVQFLCSFGMVLLQFAYI